MLLNKTNSFFQPLNAIAFFTLFYYFSASYIVYMGAYTSIEYELLSFLVISVLIAWWVHEDKKKQKYHAPYEFAAFVFFAWVLVVPYYLWRTRGVEGIKWSILVVAYFFLPYIYWFLVERFWWTA